TLRPGKTVWRRSEHGQAARRGCLVGGGERLSANARRTRLRRGVRRRAQVPRDAALSGGTRIDEPDPLVHRRARVGDAEVFLMAQDGKRPPLAGLRVIALEQAVAGPFCTRQLADMGADVIKVERTGVGDPARAYDAAIKGQSAYFAWLNRGKRSVELDLSKPEQRADFGF